MRILRAVKRDGWLAIANRNGMVDIAHIHAGTGGRPEVTLCESFRNEGTEVDTYSRLRKQFHLDRYHVTTSLRFSEYQFLIALRIQTMQQAKIDIEAIDVPEVVQRNIAALYEPPGSGVAMLGFSADGGLLTFTYGGELLAFRRLDITIDQVINADFDDRHELFDCTALKIDERNSLLDRIVLEIQRSLDIFERQHRHIRLARLLVMPLPEKVGLAAYLAKNLYITVEAVDLAKAMDFSKVPELRTTKRQAQCFHLLGAALRGFEVRT